MSDGAEWLVYLAALNALSVALHQWSVIPGGS